MRPLRRAWLQLRPHLGALSTAVVVIALGIALAAASLLANHALRDGFERSIDALAGRADLEIVARGEKAFDGRVLEQIREVPGVTAAASLLNEGAFLDVGEGPAVRVIGVDMLDEATLRVYERAEGRAALVTYVMAGDPDPETSLAILRSLPKAGADIVEFGLPFTDPMADGPAIQAAGLRALKVGQDTVKTLDLVRRFRAEDADTPVILMGYFNPIHLYGVEDFAADAVAAGVDGLIVVDLPPEEEAELKVPADRVGLSLIRLVSPNTSDARIARLMQGTSGFVYYVSITGITGTRSAEASGVAKSVARIKKATTLPVAVGFGVKTPEQAEEIARVADAAVVGSAIVEHAAKGDAKAVLSYVSDLAKGVRRARASVKA